MKRNHTSRDHIQRVRTDPLNDRFGQVINQKTVQADRIMEQLIRSLNRERRQ